MSDATNPNPANPDPANPDAIIQDSINPAHYRATLADDRGGAGQPVEVIDIIEAHDLTFHAGNAMKYLLRAGRKRPVETTIEDVVAQDLGKARWYLARELGRARAVRNCPALGFHILTHGALTHGALAESRMTGRAVCIAFGITGFRAWAIETLLSAALTGGDARVMGLALETALDQVDRCLAARGGSV